MFAQRLQFLKILEPQTDVYVSPKLSWLVRVGKYGYHM